MTEKYKIGIEFVGYIAGGMPSDENVYKSVTMDKLRRKYVRELKSGEMKDVQIEDLAEQEKQRLFAGNIELIHQEDIQNEQIQEAAAKERQESGLTIFNYDENDTPCIMEMHIKSCLKNCLERLQIRTDKKSGIGTKSMSRRVIDGVFIKPEILPLNGEIVILKRMMAFNRMKGTQPIRVSENRIFEAISKPKIEFTLVNFSPELTENILKTIFEFASNVGLGAHRKYGYGKFKVIHFEKIE